jgi:ubiquitin-protein ligase
MPNILIGLGCVCSSSIDENISPSRMISHVLGDIVHLVKRLLSILE